MGGRFTMVVFALGLPASPRPAAPPAPPARPPLPPAVLTVYAAASLTDAFGRLGRVFEAGHPGTAVRFSFAGSQQLALQLEQGAPADLFASADQRWMDYAKEKGLVEGETPVFARNRLVVIVPRTNPARIGKLQDLARRGTKMVVAAEAVPAGKYTREALAKLAGTSGYPGGYEKKVLANVVSQEENVKSVVSKVQLGEADAGVVYRSDVTASVARYVTVLDIPDAANVIARYPIGVVKAATHAAAARQFIELVTSDEGQRVLQQHGLLPARAVAATR
ncbi:MAG TPA: molybdate ABC transporter substrate-binding protein [Gemmatimonadales bacterium]|jgi:molybdate transport system substrate-binding protein|nr:molybdate ABC transporter substrate-binding protein [Gemmatimonadales bacterium]